MRWLTIVLVVGISTAAAGLAAYSCRPAQRDPATLADAKRRQSAAAAQRVTVAALGRLEPKGGVIAIGAMAGTRLDRLMVVQGQDVNQGDALAYLDAYPLRAAEEEYAKIQLEEAKARLVAETTAARTAVVQAEVAVQQARLQSLELEAHEARVRLLEAQFDVAQKDVERLQGLAINVVSPQEKDHQALLARKAREELAVAKAELAQLQASRGLAEQSTLAQLEAAKANLGRVEASAPLAALEQNIKMAGVRLEQTVIRAPISGQILRTMAQPGEMIGGQPILQMGNVREMQVVAEVYETDVGLVKRRQKVTVRSRALPRPLTGTIEQIGVMVAPNQALSIEPSARADVRVVNIWIRLEDSEAASRLVNLQVEVEIDLGEPSPHAPAQQPAKAT